MTSSLAGPITWDSLLLHKKLEPLPLEGVAELRRIEGLPLVDMSEADVREEIITPLLRILGYSKGDVFSVDREKHITFLDKNRFIDYSVTLWTQNFWLIEAKKPRPTQQHFEYEELRQALEYSIHPEINAALVVLADGAKMEVFDRETSVTEPVLTVELKNLVQEFDKIRLLLEPFQIWFFEKRRVVRLLDRVFDKEFNTSRVQEFESLVVQRLDGKRAVIIENCRRQAIADPDAGVIEKADIDDIVDALFFLQLSLPQIQAMTEKLTAAALTRTFQSLHLIFPDEPRDANDYYHGHSLMFLMALGEKGGSTAWIPSWLSPRVATENRLEGATRALVEMCVTHFERDPARRVIVAAWAAFRRAFKVFSVTNEDMWANSELMHRLERYAAPETSWRQMFSSPERHMVLSLDSLTRTAMMDFVRSCRDERGEFLTETAKLKLRGLWQFEVSLMAHVPNYWALRREKDLGEQHPTEYANVTYDNLGHFALCLVDRFPKWKAYVLEHLKTQVEKLAATGSWQAREWLGIPQTTSLATLPDQELAGRFFFGDVPIFQQVKRAYARP